MTDSHDHGDGPPQDRDAAPASPAHDADWAMTPEDSPQDEVGPPQPVPMPATPAPPCGSPCGVQPAECDHGAPLDGAAAWEPPRATVGPAGLWRPNAAAEAPRAQLEGSTLHEFAALAAAELARCPLETSQVECRFAGLRRRLRADGGTRGRHFADLSAAFLLQRARILERPGPAKRRGRPCRRSARRRGGGGTHRAAMAAVLHEAWGTGLLGGARDRPARRAVWQELHREAWRRRRAGGGGRGRDVGAAGAGRDQGATVAGTQSSCNGAVGRWDTTAQPWRGRAPWPPPHPAAPSPIKS